MGKIAPLTERVATLTSELDQKALKIANLLEDKRNIINSTLNASEEQHIQVLKIQTLLNVQQGSVLPMMCELLSLLDMYYELTLVRRAIKDANSV